jgi:hypothetical protein
MVTKDNLYIRMMHTSAMTVFDTPRNSNYYIGKRLKSGTHEEYTDVAVKKALKTSGESEHPEIA